jgi:hypothetical protein
MTVRALFLVAWISSSLANGVCAPATILEPAGDRWMYWFGDFDGKRTSASVYGAYGAFDYIASGYDFDDRHGQFLLDFDTTSIAPAGRGAGNYQVSSISVRLVVNEDNQFVYDPTPDDLATFRGAADADLGRPIELFGVGYRSGFSRETFRENSPFNNQPFLQQGNVLIVKSRRNAYAMDFIAGQPRDISNNVEENFSVRPWAVGQVPGYADLGGELVPSPLAAGALVPYDSIVTFSIDTTDPLIRSYVQEGLNAGRLQFMITSLTEHFYRGDEGVSGGFPSFYTKENFNHVPADNMFLAPRLTAEVAIGTPLVHRPKLSIERRSPSGFRISFATETGHTYQLQYRGAPGQTSVTNVGVPVTGDGSIRFIDDPADPGTNNLARFYHLLVTRIP